jgi:hypothetical protein
MLLKLQESSDDNTSLVDQFSRHREFLAMAEQYLQRLPLINLNVCPICGKVNKARLDVWGIDGYYWASSDKGIRRGYGADCCEHLNYYSGRLRYKIYDPSLSHSLIARKTFMQNPFRERKFLLGSAFPYIAEHERYAEDSPEFVVGEIKIDGGHTLFPVGCYSQPGRTKGFPLGAWFSKEVTDLEKGYWKSNQYLADYALKDLIDQKRLHWTRDKDQNTVLYTGTFDQYPHPYPSDQYLQDPEAGEEMPL